MTIDHLLGRFYALVCDTAIDYTTDKGYMIYAVTDIVIDAITLSGNSSSGAVASLAGVTILAGQSVPIAFTGITITSGTAIIYSETAITEA